MANHGEPEPEPVVVRGHGELRYRSPALFEADRRGAHRLVHRRFAPRQAELGPGFLRLVEALAEKTHAEPFATRPDGRHVVVHVALRKDSPLAGVERIRAGQDR